MPGTPRGAPRLASSFWSGAFPGGRQFARPLACRSSLSWGIARGACRQRARDAVRRSVYARPAGHALEVPGKASDEVELQ